MDLFNNFRIKYEYFKYGIKKYFTKLPKIKLSIMKERDEIGTYAYTNNNEMEEALCKKNPIILHYHRDLFTFLPQYRKAILLHEFTHISDFIKYRKCKEVTMIMCTYSEFHATQIEFMKLCGIKRVTTKCRKPLDTIIAYQGERITIKKYIEILLAEVLAILDEDLSVLDENMQAANAVALIKHLMYFFGTVSFYEESQNELLLKYFYILGKYEYGDMFMQLYVDVTQEQYKYNLKEYIGLINKITGKYLGL